MWMRITILILLKVAKGLRYEERACKSFFLEHKLFICFEDCTKSQFSCKSLLEEPTAMPWTICVTVSYS